MSVVFVQRQNSGPNSMFTVQITGYNFQDGQNCGVSLDSIFRLCCFVFSWKTVFTTGHCIKLCEIPSVFRLEILSILNTFRNPVSIQNLLNLSCGDSFSIRFSYCSNKNFCYAGKSLSKGTSVLRNLIVPSQQIVPFSRKKIHTLHIFLRLSRKN